MERATSKTKLSRGVGREIKRVADEGKPVVGIPVIVEPIEVGIALGVVPPDVANLPLAIEDMYRMSPVPLPRKRPNANLGAASNVESKFTGILCRIYLFFGNFCIHARNKHIYCNSGLQSLRIRPPETVTASIQAYYPQKL